MEKIKKPLVLMILDGWGYSERTDSNAVTMADTPNWDRLWDTYPHTLIRCSGADVGLPGGQMGNSEVGHLNLGAGRVVYQEYTRISRAIRTGSFFTNMTLTDAVDKAIESDKALHVMGLLSPGGVHSHEAQIHAMVKLAVDRGVKNVYLHAFLDGRDTPPKSAGESIKLMEDKFAEYGGGSFASVVGRYFAMDRDNRWDRVREAYAVISCGKSKFTANSADEALATAYARGESDEFVRATAILNSAGKRIEINDGDVLAFMNYRSDRAREITRAFYEPGFDNFDSTPHQPELGAFVTLTEYNKEFDLPVAFPPERMRNIFAEYISGFGLRQLRLAETEKYAHVTFFFNGGREEPFEFEDRVLIDSPLISVYDLQPEMSAYPLTDALVDAINKQEHDVIICNYANADMVGHTGNLEASIESLEAVDDCLGRVIAALEKIGGEMLVTADHGNAEQMMNYEINQPHTSHTTNPVPLVYVGNRAELIVEKNSDGKEKSVTGTLPDIAPNMLYLLGLEQPIELTGHNLLQGKT